MKWEGGREKKSLEWSGKRICNQPLSPEHPWDTGKGEPWGTLITQSASHLQSKQTSWNSFKSTYFI